MKKEYIVISKVALIAICLLLAIWFIPKELFDFWDFRNNLWGPSHLLLQNQSPYLIKQLFPGTNAIWMPAILGLLFPIGLLDFAIASRLWLVFSLAAIALTIFYSCQDFELKPQSFAIFLLISFFFPPVILHLCLGQISLFVIISLFAAISPTQNTFWRGFFCVIALTKPQLSFLVLPGIFVHEYQVCRSLGILRLSVAILIWIGILLIPLFVFFPNWVSDFIAAIRENANWAQPSLLFLLTTYLGSGTAFKVWLFIAVLASVINGWIWKKQPPQTSLVWSLALTCLVSPYIWSWDFVLLLPCFIHLFRQSNHRVLICELLIGFLIGSIFIWKARWNSSISDEVLIWVPSYLFFIYLLNIGLTKLLSINRHSFIVVQGLRNILRNESNEV